MALFEGSDEERTETASAYRREEFRKKGTVAVSRELLSVALLLAVASTLYFSVNGIFKEFSVLIERFFKFGSGVDFSKTDFLKIRTEMGVSFFWMVSPVFLVALLAGLLASAAQVGFYITWEPLAPNWDRINPVSGFQRLLSSKGIVEALKAVLKIALVSWVAWKFCLSNSNVLGLLLGKAPGEEAVLVLQVLGKLFLTITASCLAIAVADYAFQRFSLEKQMKMTRRELKEEYKLREGDPLIKSRIKGIQKRIAGRRMMEEVPKATVIVTNPTHLAVALQYEDGMGAPKVIAKGAGFVAEKIRELARSNGIPIVENKPLARTLFKNIKIGHFIPKELYKAVAEVLAYVFKLKGFKRASNT